MWTLLLAQTASAAVLHVAADGSGDHTTIQSALTAASAGDEITVGPGTWSGVIDLRWVDVTLRSTDGAAATVLDGQGLADRVIQTLGSDTLSGFTVRNGDHEGLSARNAALVLEDMVFEDLGRPDQAGGAVSLEGSTASLARCTFTGGQALDGGHVWASASDLECTDCTLAEGHATNGGGMFLEGGSLSLVGGLVQDNAATAGGGLYLGAGASLSLDGVTLVDNDAYAGAGVYAAADNTLAITGTLFEGNGSPDYATALSLGGAIYLSAGAVLELSDSQLIRNHAYYGGAVYGTYATAVILADSTFEQNLAYYGGALYAYYTGSVHVSGSLMDTNTGYYGGGAAFVYVADDTVYTDNTWQDNAALYGGGGAIYQYYASSLTSSSNTWTDNVGGYAGGALYLYYLMGPVSFHGEDFAGNEATYSSGGAVWANYAPVEDGAVAVQDSLFQHNVAYQGGGIYATSVDLVVSGTTVVGNAGTLYGGGGIWAQYGELSLTDVVIDDNTAPAEGGGVGLRFSDRARLDRVSLAGNRSDGAGGGLYLKDVVEVVAHNVALLDNHARYGGGLYQSGSTGGQLLWTNLRAQDNSARHGGGLALIESDLVSLENVSLVANRALESGAAVYQYQSPLRLWSSVVAFHDDVPALYADDVLSGTSEFLYGALFENAAGDVAGEWVTPTAGVVDHPRFAAFTDDAEPDNDTLVPLQDSPLLDAGFPEVADADGSPNDIGATGGPHVFLQDADSDGWSDNLDCDDSDPSAHPGGDEAWYDGVNGDCLGLSDFDQDGDGHDAAEHGGDDCRDRDPGVWETCPDGADPSSGDGEDTGRCSTLGGTGSAGWIGVALIGLGRRRRG